MRDEGALHLGRTQTMAGDVEDVVDSADDPEISVLVLPRTIAREIDSGLAGKFAPVGFVVTLVVAPQSAKHRGPWLGDDEFTAAVPRNFLALIIDDLGHHAEERTRAGARFRRRHARQRRDHDRAGFSLPPRIHNGATFLADHGVIPHPRFGVNRLSHGAEQTQGIETVAEHVVVTPAHKRTDRGRRRIENSDTVPINHLPEPVGLRLVGSAFVDEDRRAV